MALVVDVPELVARLGIKAERRGRELWACCPLPGHDEKTPSWQIRDDQGDDERHGRWRCLGKCHTGGSPVGLAMQILNLPAGEAYKWIRSSATNENIALAVELLPSPLRKRRFRLPAGVVVAPLGEWVETARAYAEQRGLTAEQVDRWGLGYAVDGHLAGRIVLPWRTGAGKLVGYTARSFTGSPKKYFEPSTDEGADRAAVYGEEHWPAPGPARDTIAVMEGSFDGYAVERVSGLPIGALAGSYLHPGHLARLSTWRRVIIVSDPDAAGNELLSALRAGLVRWVEVVSATLPRGFDANKLERREGPEALRAALGMGLQAPDAARAVG